MDNKALFRDADGNYYTLNKDGTLHRMENGPDAAGGPLGDPEAWLIRQEPVGEVPDFLRERFDRQPPRCHAELKTIPREAPRLTAPVAPFRPAWARPAARPRSVTLGQPPRLMHRGREVTPLTVFPPDDRRVYYDPSYPWGCVCRVIDPTRNKAGSGVIVGPRHVLTASHCINWSDVNVTVEVLRYITAASATTSATSVWRYTEITTDPFPYSEVDEDYAVIVTADRIGDWFGSLGCRTYDSGWDGDRVWHNIGYPGDFGGLVPQRVTRRARMGLRPGTRHVDDRRSGEGQLRRADVRILGRWPLCRRRGFRRSPGRKLLRRRLVAHATRDHCPGQ
jgi:hypothetical protein